MLRVECVFAGCKDSFFAYVPPYLKKDIAAGDYVIATGKFDIEFGNNGPTLAKVTSVEASENHLRPAEYSAKNWIIEKVGFSQEWKDFVKRSQYSRELTSLVNSIERFSKRWGVDGSYHCERIDSDVSSLAENAAIGSLGYKIDFTVGAPF